MKQGSKVLKLFFVIFFSLFFSKIALAGVPVPWGAKLLRDDTAIVGGGNERKMVSYETKASKEQLFDYYLKQMAYQGYSLFMNAEQNLVFNKANELVVILVLPSRDGKTQFMITTASMDSASNLASSNKGSCEPIPSVPIYPGASCMQSMRLKSGGAKSVAYSTNDAVNVVFNFYREKMPNYSWSLEKELNLGDALRKGNLQGVTLPSQDSPVNDFYNNANMMKFINREGDSCSINIMSNPTSKGGTLISIIYEEKPAQ